MLQIVNEFDTFPILNNVQLSVLDLNHGFAGGKGERKTDFGGVLGDIYKSAGPHTASGKLGNIHVSAGVNLSAAQNRHIQAAAIIGNKHIR